MKLLLKIILLIIIISVAGLYFGRNYLVASAVEEGGSYALGVDTKLGSAGLDISGGSVSLNNFKVPNPEGFKNDNFLTVKRTVLDVNEGSVFDDHVIIDSIIIDGIDLNVVQVDGSGNYKALLDHLNRLQFSESSESKRTFQIKKASIRDITVAASLTVAGKKISSKEYTVNNFTMTDIGGADGQSMAEVSASLFKRIISHATVNNKTFLNLNADQLKNTAKEKIDELKEETSDKVKELGKSIIGGK